jgi:hypothetical protein
MPLWIYSAANASTEAWFEKKPVVGHPGDGYFGLGFARNFFGKYSSSVYRLRGLGFEVGYFGFKKEKRIFQQRRLSSFPNDVHLANM